MMDEELECSFCSKSKGEVAILFKSVKEEEYICNECVEDCKKILNESDEVNS